MKRSSRSNRKTAKNQKVESNWISLNNELRKGHIETYGYSLGDYRTEYLNYRVEYLGMNCHIHRFFVNVGIKEKETQNPSVSNIRYHLVANSFEKWLSYSVDLQKHWSDKSIRIDELDIPVEFDRKSKMLSPNYSYMYLWAKITPIPENENLWILHRNSLIYLRSGDDSSGMTGATLLRNLKLDRNLPIKEIICYLAVVYNISDSILESLFWCNYSKLSNLSGAIDPARRLVWNCDKIV